MSIFHKKKSKYIQIGVALFIIIVIITGISYVGYLAVFDYGKIPQQEYLTPNTKDTTRIMGDNPQQISMKVSQIMFPSLWVNSGTNNSSNNSISSSNNNTNSVINLPFSESNENIINLAFAFAPLSKWENMPIVLDNVDNNNNKNLINFSQSDLLKASAIIDEYIANNTAAASSNANNRIILAPIDNPQFSLLAASWSSYSGDPILFIDSDDASLPDETLQRLEARTESTTAVTMNNSEISSSSSSTINEKDNKKLFLYVLAPPGYISDNVRQQLSKYGEVRIPDLSNDPFTASVRMAQYRDFDSDFGWGMDKSNEGNSEAGYFNYIIVNPDNIGSGIAALPLSHSAKYGPILFTNNEYIPPIVDNYLWSTKADFFMTPAEGPFNHYWIISNPNSNNNNNNDGISYIVQSRFDYGTEIGAYRMQGAGMSSLEALFAGWIAFSIFGMIYVAISMRKSLQNVSLLQKLAWPLVVLMLGPFGLVAYWLSFNGRRMIEMNMNKNENDDSKKLSSSPSSRMMVMWERPIWSQSIVATFVAVAFAASTMIATAYLLETFIGLPLQVIDGSFYWFGNGMILTIAISYGVAVIVSLFVFQAPMFAQQRKQSYKKVLKIALVAVLASMTSVSLGMMTLMYFMHMWWLPMVPEEDDLAWFGSMFFSTLIGAVIAMPINYLLVRRGIKVGEM